LNLRRQREEVKDFDCKKGHGGVLGEHNKQAKVGNALKKKKKKKNEKNNETMLFKPQNEK